GGVYAANHYAKIEDHKEKDEPIAIAPTPTAKSDPPPSGGAGATSPVTAAKPPPVAPPPVHPTTPGPTTPGPKPSGTPSATPSAQPTAPPGVIVIPSSIPTFPFPVPPFGPLQQPGQQ